MKPDASRKELAVRTRSRPLNLEGYRWLFDGLPERALIIDDQCEIVDANNALLDELGETRDRVIGRPCCELTPFCEQSCHNTSSPCPGQKAFASGSGFSEMRAYRDSDGKKHYIELTVSPLLDQEGRVQAVLETRRDINAKRHLENTLTAIYHLGQELVLTRDETQIARAVVNTTRQTLNFQICALLLIENGDLGIAASAGYATAVDHIRLPLNGDRGITVQVARSGQPLYVPDVTQNGRFYATQGFEIRSELAVPLKVGDRIIGVLNVESDRLDAFDTIDRQLLITLADVAAVALESARAYRAEQQRASELAALHKLGLALVNEHDPAAIANRIFTELGDLLGIETAVVSLVNQPTDELVLYGVDKGSPIPWQTLSLDGPSLSGHIVRTGEPLLIADISQDDLPVPGVQYGERTSSWLGVPLRVEARIIGLINIQSYSAHAFGEAELVLLTQIAAQVAPVLENAWLYQMELQRRRETAAINRITRGLAAGLSFEHLFDSLAHDLGALVHFDRVSIALSDNPEAPDTFRMHAVHDGPEAPLAAGTLMPIAASAASTDLLNGLPHLTIDLADETDYPAERALYEAGLRSRVNLPLLARGRIIGSLNLVSRETGAYNGSQLPILQQAADAVAAAIENVQLYRALQQHASQLEEQVTKRTAELQAERDRTRAILDSAAEGVIVTDLVGNIEYINPAAEALTGYSREEALGRNASLWQSGHTPPEVYEEMWRTIQAGGTWEGELLNRRRDGNCYDALLTIAPIPGPAGDPVGFVGMQQDISERKELDRLKDLFVSNVSHELRTPLTNLKLYLKLMEKGRPEKKTQYMATLDREANRLQQLIEDLLSLSRLDVGKAQPEREETDLNRLVSQLVNDRVALAAEKGLSLGTELAPNLAPVMADEKMLAQVLTNLTTNAMNYTSAGGRILVRTGIRATDGIRPADWITVSVIDTGYGVLPEERQYLFDRFYRGEAARRAGAPGTGLGLAICREIVERHDGHITVESELGKGSTFTVWLPTPG